MNTNEIKTICCDVLCIGGSGAAVSAAHMAIKKGKKVVLVSKGKAGRSGNAIMVGGGFGIDGYNSKYVLGQELADENYMPEQLMEKIIKASFYIGNPRLAEQFATDAPLMMKEFLEWAENAKQNFKFVKSGLFAVSGSSIGKAIYQGIKQSPDLVVYDDVMMIDLIVEDGKVVGAVGLDLYSGEYLHFQTKSVVMATGGYQPHSLKNTITDMTGDGMAMALRAGARVSDMEFLLYIPTAVTPSYLKGSILPYLFTIPIFMPLDYDVIDCNGKRIEIPHPFNNVPGSNKILKLIYSYFWSKGTSNEIMGGKAYFDYSKHTDEEIIKGFDHFIKHYSNWHKEGTYNGINLYELRDYILKERKLEIALGNEYSNGGIVINEKMETDIEGLFAAGEVTSGLFGAFRAGDGLSEMLAHGYRAGISAADYSDKVEFVVKSKAQAEQIVANTERILYQEGTKRARHIFRRLEQCADKGLGVIRHGQSTAEALEEVEKIYKTEIQDIKIPSKSKKYNLDLLYYLELENLSLCIRAGLQAALKRKESRGTHVREDYPMVDNENYLYRITSKLENGELINGKITSEESLLALPNKNYSTIADYMAEIL